jgi:hypothetical protein
MFKPRDKRNRLNYGSMLKPPKGFVLQRAVATSFSLDFDALTAAAFALGLGGDTDTELIDNPAMCLHSLQKITDKLVVFSEAGQIKRPSKDNPLYALLSQTISTVTLEQKDGAGHYPSFHPKTWIIEYASKTERRYRLLVMSRNLSFDRSYDACVAFDGVTGGTKAAITKTKPLINFLEFLRDTIKKDAPNQKGKKDIVENLIEALQGVSFDLGENHGAFEDFDLIPMGTPKAKSLLGTDFDRADFHELVIMSPFLSDDIIKRFSEPNPYIGESRRKRTLITRATELYKLKKCDIDKWSIYVMKDEVVDGEQNAGEDGDIDKQDIHAKIYARHYHRTAALYLGSANASYSAFNRNIEFMVALHSYQKYSKGYTAKNFLADLLGDENAPECPFRKVESAEITNAEFDATAEEERRKLEFTIKTFCRANTTATVTETDGKYDIELTVDKKSITPDFARLTIAPLGEERKAAGIAEQIRFEDVDLLHLSEFYTLTAKTEGEEMHRIIMIPTTGIPRSKVEEKVVSKAIADTNAFNEYLNAILSDDILAGYLSREMENRSGIGEANSRQAGAALYEKLLYAAAHHPERFKEIAYIEERMSGNGIITDEFKRIFKVFETAVQNADKGGKA